MIYLDLSKRKTWGLDSHAGGEHFEKFHLVLSGGDLTGADDWGLCLCCCWDHYHLLHGSVCVDEGLGGGKKTCRILRNEREVLVLVV